MNLDHLPQSALNRHLADREERERDWLAEQTECDCHQHNHFRCAHFGGKVLMLHRHYERPSLRYFYLCTRPDDGDPACDEIGEEFDDETAAEAAFEQVAAELTEREP